MGYKMNKCRSCSTLHNNSFTIYCETCYRFSQVPSVKYRNAQLNKVELESVMKFIRRETTEELMIPILIGIQRINMTKIKGKHILSQKMASTGTSSSLRFRWNR